MLLAYQLQNVLSPAALTATVHDYAPQGAERVNILRLDATGPVSITGLALKRRALWLVHRGTTAANTITLVHASASSTLGYRFYLPNASNVVLPIGGAVFVWYDDFDGVHRLLVAS